MNTNRTARLARLCQKLAATTDPQECADLETDIADLEAIIADLSRANIFATTPGSHTQTLSDNTQAGAAVAGNVGGGVVAPLFAAGGSGNYIAEVIHITYQGQAAAPPADYDAALRRYLTDLYDQHATLDMRGIDERQVDPPLGDLYISLTLSEPQHEELRGGVRGFMQRASSLSQKRAEESPSEGGPRTVDWPAAVRAHARIAVIGKPGSGKTTLLHYTAVRLAEALARDDGALLAATGLDAPLVPVLLPLRELGAYLQSCNARELSGRNPTLLLDCLATYYAGRALDLPADFFRRLCNEGRALLLLDGLDEVASTDDRQVVSALIGAFATRYPRCRCIVTARVAAYVGAVQLGQAFAICTVNDLDDIQQQRFIANWSRCVYRLIRPSAPLAQVTHAAAQFDAALWAALNRNGAVRAIVPNPLLLTIVAIVFYNRSDLPENRAGLYEACVNVLLRGGRGKVDSSGKAREHYSGTAGTPMSGDEKRELLAAIAYTMHTGGAQHKLIDATTLVAIAADQLHRSLRDAVAAKRRAQAFVRELPVHIGLLDELEQQQYGFSHLSFQEFLAARHIANHDDLWDALLDQYGEPWWREVILLCAGFLPQERCWRFLERLIGRGADVPGRARALELAADALAELERFKGQGRVREQVQFQTLKILAAPPDKAPAAARVACGRALAHVGDPRPRVCTLPPAMVRIAGGTFVIGSTRAEAEQAGVAYEQHYLKRGDKETAKSARTWPEDEINAQPLTLAAFELGRHPVTNAQYALFIADGGYDAAQPWWDAAARAWLARADEGTPGLERWQWREFKHQPEFWNDDRFGGACTNHPVVGISWYEAVAFCRWLSQHARYNPDGSTYRLPTEAEWEYAVRGASRRMWTWGSAAPDAEHANFDQQYNGTTAVGCFPRGASPEGVQDLAGNVREWTTSVYAPYPYNRDDGREQVDDPARKRFTLRGGSWYESSVFQRASGRSRNTPDNHFVSVGFRLARHLPV